MKKFIYGIRSLVVFAVIALAFTSCKLKKEEDPQPQPERDPVTFSGTISQTTRLENIITNPNFPDYLVNSDLVITADLTIDPGVVIAFGSDVRMDINSTASIKAIGTADNKIRFVGSSDVVGHWKGIMLYSTSPNNEFNYVEFANAGRSPIYDGVKTTMAMSSTSVSQVTIKNSLFRKSGGYGLYVKSGTNLLSFSNNQFTENVTPIKIDAGNVGYLDGLSTYTGNTNNYIEVTQAIINTPGAVATWKAIADNTPYMITQDVTVNTNWKLEAGITLLMATDTKIYMQSSSALDAKGTAIKKIVIKGAGQSGSASWNGLILSNTGNNVMEYVEIQDGGKTAALSGYKANVFVGSSTSNLTIRNSTLRGSGGYGIFVRYGGTLNNDAATVNVFETNTQGTIFKQ